MTQQNRFRNGYIMLIAQLHHTLINLSTLLGPLYQAFSVVIDFKNITIDYCDYDALLIKIVPSSEIVQSSSQR